MKIALTGASGFIGKSLIDFLLAKDEDIQIIALSRRERVSDNPRVEWRKCDLFSMLDLENALSGCEKAIYLVHSMLPSSQLVQGKFEDFDLVLADNFIQAAKKNNISHLIYLGGIIPKDETLSDHLASRLEVEDTLRSEKIPLTALRAGVIIGPAGSSFRIMLNLVKRLPIMLCPSWTQTLSCPVFLEDVHQSIYHCLKDNNTKSKVFDIGGRERVSYREMMRILAKKLGKKPLMLNVPFFSPGLSKLWVCLITGAPKNLVYPLISSLKSSMIPDENKKLEIENYQWKSFKEAIEQTIDLERADIKPNAFKFTGSDDIKKVRSIQRIYNPPGMNAKSIADLYFSWLPKFFRPFIHVEKKDDNVFFKAIGLRAPLLVLTYSPSRSSDDRQLFYITGGILAIVKGRGRLEFRSTVNEKVTIAAIHEFIPSLPWFLYKYTQAIIHLFVMKSFSKIVMKGNL